MPLFDSTAERLDRRYGWDKLPRPIAMLVLIGLRNILRKKNLHDTGRGPLDVPDVSVHPRYRTARTLDGTYNNLDDPLMGSLGSRFGRNVPLEATFPERDPLEPNPRLVSRELLTRKEFIPATTINLLAGAWIQFEVHDWFSHGKNESENPWVVPLEADDDWPANPMLIERTRRDPSSDGDGPPTFVTDDTHWRDASQIYGRDPAFAAAIRSGEHGKLTLDADGLIPESVEAHVDLTGVAGNFWVGLALLHSVFMREHNAVCDRLHAAHPDLSDDKLYDKARLVVAALMAKIHTTEWTPAIIAHPTTVTALRANWWGLEGERLDKLIGRRTSNEVIRGIPGSPTALHGVPYQLTEEFVAVYRMHPLIPDEYVFRSLNGNRLLQERTLPELGVLHVRERFTEMSMADALYSFGISHPGAITLHNYPRFLQHFDRPDGSLIDLASIDVLRVRERGVPRYNEFRRLLHLKAYDTFEEMADTPEHAEDLRRIYSDPEEVDTMIGMYAEPKPKGFGFSDTAFRIFILMASRRIEADRFFTRDYRPEVYTAEGIDWVESNSMRTLLLRHFPELTPALDGVENPFAPWNVVGSDTSA
ncbi:MAG TPA: peroxidase family protein [Gaiellaceae bacterium]|nr:peroxidase family protein [Gaiellaceae bacterium]